jgi:hypothetical protein
MSSGVSRHDINTNLNKMKDENDYIAWIRSQNILICQLGIITHFALYSSGSVAYKSSSSSSFMVDFNALSVANKNYINEKNITFFKKFFLLFPGFSQNFSKQLCSFIRFNKIIPLYSLSYLSRVFLYVVRSPNIDILYTYRLSYIKLRFWKMFIRFF